MNALIDVQFSAAVTSFLDAILTRNTANLDASPIKVYTPGEFANVL